MADDHVFLRLDVFSFQFAKEILRYRFSDGHPECYDLFDNKWEHCPHLWDIFIGELDVDDLTEDEANELIASLVEKRKHELPLKVERALKILYREPLQ